MTQIKITYEGAHNFDWDAHLEHLAGKVRYDSSMDFSNMKRSISFRFDKDSGADSPTEDELFAAAVRSAFPDFVVDIE